LTCVSGQSRDSLIYILNNGLEKNDTDRFNLLCKVISSPGDDENNKVYCEQAVKLAEKLKLDAAKPYYYLGYSYVDGKNLPAALDNFIKAANYYKKTGNNHRLGATYMAIAETYNKQGNHHNEIYYMGQALKIFENTRDTLSLATEMNNLGYAYYSNEQYDSALFFYSRAQNLFLRIHDSINYAYCIGNMGLVYFKLSEYDLAKKYLLKGIGSLTKNDDERPAIEFNIAYAGILMNEGNISKAHSLATKAFNKADELGIEEYKGAAAWLLAQIYRNSGRYDSAFRYITEYIRTNDTLQSVSNIRKMADLRTAFEVGQKQSEVEILQKSKVFRGIVILGLVVILILAIGLIVVYYMSLKRSKKLMAELDERRVLLEKQSTELKKKNDQIIKTNEELKQLYEITNSQKEEIISSINYAQRIQMAILPPETYITELINENFVFYKPKEIVSGDFYWIKQIDHHIVLVAADCTGHGVPGAFMSMLGIGYLNEIVQNKKEIRANQILNELRKEIKHSLRQTGKKEESREGIEMALCVIDTTTSVLQYSGAFNSLYIISSTSGKPQLTEIKADMMPVGVHFLSDKSFTNHEIKLEIGDTFYIFTDGFIDQAGGNKNTRFGSKNLKKLLLKICDQPMFEQRDILERKFNEWKGDQAQRDDILIIGARI